MTPAGPSFSSHSQVHQDGALIQAFVLLNSIADAPAVRESVHRASNHPQGLLEWKEYHQSNAIARREYVQIYKQFYAFSSWKLRKRRY
jgi:hypothetical protein